MSKKRSDAKPISARKLFGERIDSAVSYCQREEEERAARRAAHGPLWIDVFAPQLERESELYLRMRSDERMQVAWGDLAKLSKDDFYSFLNVLERSRTHAIRFRHEFHHWQEELKKIRELKEVVRTLQSACEREFLRHAYDETMLALVPYPEYLREQWNISMTKAVPGLLKQLKAAHVFLEDCERRAADILHKAQQELSRKSVGGRMEFIRKVAVLTRQVIKKPHYELVAALTNVVFDLGDEDSVSADGVRKIVTRPTGNDAAIAQQIDEAARQRGMEIGRFDRLKKI